MNKRVGAESVSGLGGGIVNKESQRCLEIAEDLCRRRRPYEAVPHLMKSLQLDPCNLDAVIQMAFLAPNFDESVDTLKQGEKMGRRKLMSLLGRKCFDDDGGQVGNFWAILETRPYMRLLQAQVRFYVEKRDYPNGAKTIIEMLRLCPGDNLGQRDWLPTLLTQSGRLEDSLFFSQVWTNPDLSGRVIPRGGCNFQKPSDKELTPTQMQRMGEYNKATFLYDAALAAFKLWGDCILARQYLQLGAKLSPMILVKVLAKTERQKELNSSSRALNSPEDAADYLWLAQDLWMAPDVWNWANNQEHITRQLLKKCSRQACNNMEKTVAEFKRCAACHQVWYCGQDCQKIDWKTHKQPCRDHQRWKAMKKAITHGRPLPKDGIPIVAASADFSSEGITSRFYEA